MPRIRMAWVALAGLVFAQAQPNAQPGSPPRAAGAPQAQQEAPPLKEEDYCTVEGVVIDARTQAPLRKAAVVLVGGRGAGFGGAGGISDASGRFVIEKIPPGRYQISLRRNGYASGDTQAGRAGNPASLTLSPGQHLKGLVLRMTPAAVISGRVVDEDGEPLAWARVTAMQYRYLKGKRELVPAGGAATDDRGEYRIFGLAPGRYWVSAAWTEREMGLRPLARVRTADRIAYPDVYYPGVVEPEQAAPVAVKAGEERSGIDFRLWPAQAVSISGRVLKPGGERAGSGLMLMIAPRTSLGFLGSARRRFAQVEASTGRFTLTNVRPGPHLLTAVYRDGENTLYARQEIEVGSADVEGIELVLAPGVTVQGRVQIEPGSAATVKLDGARVLLQSEEQEMQFFGMGDGRVREDGSFELRNLSPGRYSVRIVGLPEGSYLKAARLGDQEALASPLMLTSGGFLNLIVSPSGGQVDGAVLDAEQKPAPGAAVVLIPEESKRHREDLFFQQAADQNGRFSFRGVPPGDYKLFAWDKVEAGAWRDPAFLDRYEDDGVKVSVKERSQELRELKLLRVEEADQ